MEVKIICAKRSNLVLAYVKVNFPKKYLKKKKNRSKYYIIQT